MQTVKMRRRLPRSAVVTVWVLGLAAVHLVLPIALARRGRHRGWIDGHPGIANLAGVLTLGVGSAGLVWSLAQHYGESPASGYKLSLVPEYLVRSGPYQYSRNPVYLSELLMWLGWAELFGSPTLLAASSALALGMRQAVRFEELTLVRAFGESWETYARDVPRWL